MFIFQPRNSLLNKINIQYNNIIITMIYIMTISFTDFSMYLLQLKNLTLFSLILNIQDLTLLPFVQTPPKEQLQLTNSNSHLEKKIPPNDNHTGCRLSAFAHLWPNTHKWAKKVVTRGLG